ncbi:MAG: hypothetical protein J5836_02605 [Clostridia bacterium]|nr:hypothetical protein [Clostridia bacterium]
MIEEVLEKVRKAEKDSSERKIQAEERADEIRLSAEKRAAEIISGAKKNAKAERINSLAIAEMRAEEEYDAVVKEAKSRGEKLKLDLDAKVEELAVKIAKDVTGGGR